MENYIKYTDLTRLINLLEGYELLLKQKTIKAEKTLTELWRTDSIYNEAAL